MATFLERYMDRTSNNANTGQGNTTQAGPAPVQEERTPLAGMAQTSAAPTKIEVPQTQEGPRTLADMAQKPTMPTKIEVPQTQEGPMAQKSILPMKPTNPILNIDLEDPHYFSKLADIMAERPMTQEEEERRKRSATASQAVAGLGNAISALSNVFLSGEAPSQTIAPIPKVEYEPFEQKARAQRQAYINQVLNGAKQDYNSYQAAKQAAANLAYKREQAAADRDAKAGINAANLAYKTDNDNKNRALKREIAQKNNSTRIQAANIRASGSGKNNREPDYYEVRDMNGNLHVYDINDDRDAAQMFGRMVNNGIFKFDPVMGEKEPKTAKEMRDYINKWRGQSQRTQSTMVLPKNQSSSGNNNTNTQRQSAVSQFSINPQEDNSSQQRGGAVSKFSIH